MLCGELGKKPDVPFKGTFNVRISPVLHRQAAIAVNGNLKLTPFGDNRQSKFDPL
ncbi:toxin-antitoxin system HicB family antitoxin, partial [Oligella sp. HMSC05A10]|uniref:toxin-antitoxin system HicB family antitoxin n=1 Tax=Oligella sp. HMSC05A10 TaxID=1581112 RepID=UPI00114CA1DA